MKFPASYQYAGGLLTPDGDVYIWPRDYHTHNQMISFLKDESVPFHSLHFYVYPGGDLSSYGSTEGFPDWEESPNIKIMMGEPAEVGATG
jgi:hypothetical protein